MNVFPINGGGTGGIPGFRFPEEVSALLKTQMSPQHFAAVEKMFEAAQNWLTTPADPRIQPGAWLPRYEDVARDVKPGERYQFGSGRGRKSARITNSAWMASFSKPIRLKGNQYLYQGRLYSSVEALLKDARDGGVDGKFRNGSVFQPSPWHPLPPNFEGPLPGPVDPQQSAPVGDFGFLSDASLSLEDKLMLLMAKLAQILDDKIEKQMKVVGDAANKADATQQSPQAGGGVQADSPLGGGNGQAGTPGGSNAADTNLQKENIKLQKLMDSRKQMFEMISNMLKGLSDTSMSVVRNLRA